MTDDAKSGNADLRHHNPSTPLQLRSDSFLKVRIEAADRTAILKGQSDSATFGLVEKSLEVADHQRLRPARVAWPTTLRVGAKMLSPGTGSSRLNVSSST